MARGVPSLLPPSHRLLPAVKPEAYYHIIICVLVSLYVERGSKRCLRSVCVLWMRSSNAQGI